MASSSPRLRCLAVLIVLRAATCFLSPNRRNRARGDELAATPTDAIFSNLVSFVRQNGGKVTDDLRLADTAPCGARGLVAGAPLEASRARVGPLLVVPARCVLDRERALRDLTPLVPASVLRDAPLDTLDGAALITLLLARERALGAASFYAPYIASLPQTPPCAWWGGAAARARALDACAACPADEREEWAAELERAAAYSARVSMGMAGDYGDALGVDADGIEWALATLSSRSMGGQDAPCLVPLLDLVNHDAAWHAFTGHWIEELPETFVVGRQIEQTGGLENGGLVKIETGLAAGDWAYWAWDVDGRAPRGREPGEELYANYLAEDYTPFEWFMNLGYIPPEVARSMPYAY